MLSNGVSPVPFQISHRIIAYEYRSHVSGGVCPNMASGAIHCQLDESDAADALVTPDSASFTFATASLDVAVHDTSSTLELRKSRCASGGSNECRNCMPFAMSDARRVLS